MDWFKSIYTLLAILFLCIGGNKKLVAQEALPDSITCQINFFEAQDAYEQGNFPRAESLLLNCLEEDDSQLSRLQRTDFYRLLAFTYIAWDYPGKAEEAVRDMLKSSPFYRINPEEDPEVFQVYVNKHRSKFRITRKRYFWPIAAGAAGVAAILVASLVSGGSDGPAGPEPLPGPPVLP